MTSCVCAGFVLANVAPSRAEHQRPAIKFWYVSTEFERLCDIILSSSPKIKKHDNEYLAAHCHYNKLKGK
jgi:hypothetical protein